MKKKLLIALSIVFASAAILSVVKSFDIKPRCGVVIGKQQSNIVHGKRNNDIQVHDYLQVKFDDGKYERVDVEFNTYMTNNIGQRVCFNGNPNGGYLALALALAVCTSVVLISYSEIKEKKDDRGYKNYDADNDYYYN